MKPFHVFPAGRKRCAFSKSDTQSLSQTSEASRDFQIVLSMIERLRSENNLEEASSVLPRLVQFDLRHHLGRKSDVIYDSALRPNQQSFE